VSRRPFHTGAGRGAALPIDNGPSPGAFYVCEQTHPGLDRRDVPAEGMMAQNVSRSHGAHPADTGGDSPPGRSSSFADIGQAVDRIARVTPP